MTPKGRLRAYLGPSQLCLSARRGIFLTLFALVASGCGDSGESDDDAPASGGRDGSGGSGSESGSGGAESAGGAGANDGTGADPSTGGDSGEPPVYLNQLGNPLYELLDNWEDWIVGTSVDITLADNILTWQMPHGGFDKVGKGGYDSPWNGSDPRSGWTGEGGVELGTIDNNATTTELLVLAHVYHRTGEEKYREGAVAALEFLLTMQLPSGGFPQVYPEREGTTYSNHVTFNDNAMVRVLVLLDRAVREESPLQGDLFTDEQRQDAALALENAEAFILAAQIEQDGQKTVWCAQHNAVTYEPEGARSYELPSKSGNESAGVVEFLMSRLQTPEVKAAVEGALAWYRSSDVQLEDTRYVSRPSDNTDDNYNPIQAEAGSTMWCRFYDLTEDTCFFSGRLPTDEPPGAGKQYDIMEIEPERRYGYQWGGSYGAPVLTYAASVGY